MGFEISPKEFDIDFMREHGYIRKKCRVCGAHFWTPHPDMDICGESPCVNYTFLGNPPTRRKYNISEMRDAFLRFFEKNGHEIITPYPVVARWRDDLLVTIASIADFQPFVTAGLADPPANPLVVSQPCLRFEDIMNVGLTAGRHLTIFEMGGHHAFNNRVENRFIYWKDQTLQYHHEFAVEELGIPEDEITYKEHFWVGGGNAGPDLEGIVRGLEVSTLVFMMYKIDGDRLEPTPISTVDTGYGIERWAWLSRGSPTAFHTIYGPVFSWMVSEVGLDIDSGILYDNTLASPHYDAMNVDIVSRYRMSIANKYGYEVEELIKVLNAFDEMNMILDHSKSVIFLIKDGAVPSNVKEGYLTRMLLRKIFRILSMRGWEDILFGLFDRQIDYWSRDFGDLREVKDIILEIVDIERNKFESILKRVPSLVRRYKKKYGSITLDHLIEIYDSHGISPEIVSEYMKSVEGVEIKVPPDFYKRVSERHLVVEPVSVKEVDVPPDLSTEELYYYDPYWRSMSARVIYADKNMLVLDKTVFYGESGGQVGDKGKVVIDGVEYNVLDTIKKNNALIHLTDKPVGKELIGKGVTGYIDWDRRYSLMRHHTATHIILGAIRRVLGSHIWQAGAEKREDIAHIDVTHYKLPTDDEVRMIEELANKVVEEGVDVEVSWLDRGYAEKIYGVKIYQGGMVPGRKLRLVKIGDWDVEACGGTHVLNTRELMYIRIVSVDKIHDGIIRFSYVAGLNAIKQARDEQDILSRVAGILGVGRRDVERSIKSILEDMDRLKDELEELEKKYVSLLGERLYSNAEVIDGIKFVYVVGEVDKNIKLGEFLESRYDDVLFLGVSRLGRGVNIVIFVGGKLRERGINAFELGRRCLSDIAKGGKGDARYARFGGRFEDRLDIIKEIIVEGVRDEQ